MCYFLVEKKRLQTFIATLFVIHGAIRYPTLFAAEATLHR